MRPTLAVSLHLLLTAVLLDATAVAAPREVRAARTARAPAIDGRIEPDVWSQASEFGGLSQQRPDNGAAASESTQVWILFDDDALYVAARLHARGPVTRVVARRDTYVECDWFGLLLDPLHDHRSGCEFFVNPDGVQYDAVISNDNQEDTSWDAVWQSAVSVDSGGWSAEIRIPLSQLRFVERTPQVWGINLIRWIRHHQEQARLVSHPRNQAGYASRFGDLAGLDGIRPRAKAELTPYLTSGVASLATVGTADPLNNRTTRTVAGGADLRWTGRSSLTVNATFRPDFGQVEVDPAVLNLSQFEQFFPEKRPFFLEGAKLYAFGDLATTYASAFRLAHPLLFYSRRIGRVPQGNTRLAADWADLPDETTIEGAAEAGVPHQRRGERGAAERRDRHRARGDRDRGRAGESPGGAAHQLLRRTLDARPRRAGTGWNAGDRRVAEGGGGHRVPARPRGGRRRRRLCVARRSRRDRGRLPRGIERARHHRRNRPSAAFARAPISNDRMRIISTSTLRAPTCRAPAAGSRSRARRGPGAGRCTGRATRRDST